MCVCARVHACTFACMFFAVQCPFVRVSEGCCLFIMFINLTLIYHVSVTNLAV